MVMQ
jgi:transposase